MLWEVEVEVYGVGGVGETLLLLLAREALLLRCRGRAALVLWRRYVMR